MPAPLLDAEPVWNVDVRSKGTVPDAAGVQVSTADNNPGGTVVAIRLRRTKLVPSGENVAAGLAFTPAIVRVTVRVWMPVYVP